MSKLILASSSPYREELLRRLKLPFQAISPQIDETALDGETPAAQVMRLASAKAGKIATEHQPALVIGSDQLATCEGDVFGKPGTHEQACRQLQAMRGRSLFFHTGLCLLNTDSGREQLDCVVYRVQFRDYSDAEIERYLRSEQPYNCAGSFKSEGLGIALVAAMEGPDPTALIGLPLLRLSDMLRLEGQNIP